MAFRFFVAYWSQYLYIQEQLLIFSGVFEYQDSSGLYPLKFWHVKKLKKNEFINEANKLFVNEINVLFF